VRRRWLVALVLAVATLLSARSVLAADEASRATQPSDVLVVDPSFGMEGGVRSSATLRRLVFGYERGLPTLVHLDEGKKVDRAIALVGRLTKLVFLDEPFAELEAIAVHEVFGHGSRSRDFGYTSTPKFALPGIYCALLGGSADDACTSFAAGALPNSVDKALAINAGGIESNHLTAWWQNARLSMGSGRFHHSDMLVYALSKLVYAASLAKPPTPTPSLNDDVDNYLSGLQRRFNRPDRSARQAMNVRLPTAYIWNFVDPVFWFSLYSIVFDSILQGKHEGQIPLPHVGRTSFLPSPRFNLSPFGAEHYLDLFCTIVVARSICTAAWAAAVLHAMAARARVYSHSLSVIVFPRAPSSMFGISRRWHLKHMNITKGPTGRVSMLARRSKFDSSNASA
jgi:hypothetical protein